VKRRALSLDGAWAMEAGALARLRDAVSALKEPSALEALGGKIGKLTSVADDVELYEVVDGVAVIRFAGVVTRELSLWGWLFGGDAVTTVLSAALAASEADAAVSSRLIVFDSPGGVVSGVAECADSVFAARSGKPLVALVPDLCCSAAYWLAAQVPKLYVGRTANVGSIGAMFLTSDVSRLLKNEGVEMSVIRSGRLKGSFATGIAPTEVDVAEAQAYVDAVAAEFRADVSRGRPKLDVDAFADGSCLTGAAAVAAGLADGVATLADLLSELRAEGAPKLPAGVDLAPVFPTDPNIEAKASNEQRADVVAHEAGAQGGIMSDTTKQTADAVTLEALAQRLAAVEAENASLRAKVTAVEAPVAAITAERGLEAFLEKARDEVKLTAGNAAYVEPVLRAAYGVSPAEGERCLATLPVLGKGTGSVLDGSARVTTTGRTTRTVPSGAVDPTTVAGSKALLAPALALAAEKGINVLDAARQLTTPKNATA